MSKPKHLRKEKVSVSKSTGHLTYLSLSFTYLYNELTHNTCHLEKETRMTQWSAHLMLNTE